MHIIDIKLVYFLFFSYAENLIKMKFDKEYHHHFKPNPKARSGSFLGTGDRPGGWRTGLRRASATFQNMALDETGQIGLFYILFLCYLISFRKILFVYTVNILRDFLRDFSRCMLFRHNATIRTD